MNSGPLANFRIAPNGNQTFGGSIIGPINFIRDAGNTLLMTSSNTYSGTTTIIGGMTTLQDFGTLQNTSEIYIRSGTLKWDDNAGVQAVANRLPSGITMWFDGGAFVFSGRTGSNTVQNLNDNLVFNSGNSQIQPAANFGTLQLTFSSYSRATGGDGHLRRQREQRGRLGPRLLHQHAADACWRHPALGDHLRLGRGDWQRQRSRIRHLRPDPGRQAGGLGRHRSTVATGSNMLCTASMTLPAGGATINSLFLQAAATTSPSRIPRIRCTCRAAASWAPRTGTTPVRSAGPWPGQPDRRQSWHDGPRGRLSCTTPRTR